MTEADYNAQISWENQTAAGYQAEIRELENQAAELTEFKAATASMQDALHDTASGILSRITGKLFGNVIAAAKGSEYAASDYGLGETQEIIQRKIEELRNSITQKQNAINSCYARIGSLQQEKQNYLAVKAQEEAARAAEEAAQE